MSKKLLFDLRDFFSVQVLSKLNKLFKKSICFDKWKKNWKKWPSKEQWACFFEIFSKKEKIALGIIFSLAMGFLVSWQIANYFENTTLVPWEGGEIEEVIVGRPQSLNPIFSPLNDADRDVTELLFRGLLNYTPEGKLVPDLAESFEIKNQGKVYEFKLKEGIFWSDGKEIISDDVVFTIETIQNPKTQSPYRLLWQEVKVEKIDKLKVRFILKEPYPPFIENFTLKILPSHVFKQISPHEFFAKVNEKMVFSGPFKIKEIEKDNEGKIEKITLERNENFYGSLPYLREIKLYFVDTIQDALAIKEKVTSIGGFSPEKKNEILNARKFKIYRYFLPRYFALFLNQKNKALSKKEVRLALSFATPKREIIEKILLGEGRIVAGPLLPENNIGGKIRNYKFNLKRAKEILKKAGFKDKNKDGILDTPFLLKFKLYTLSQKELEEAAKAIKETWKKIGVALEINSLSPDEFFQKAVKERKYDILLFGESLNIIPDPFVFWHSTQSNFPGLNLSMYKNEKVDQLLVKARTETDEKKRKNLLRNFQLILTTDIPAIFLYSPYYLYAVDKNIKGVKDNYVIIDPSKRFLKIENWYIKQKRVKKEEALP